ncbi:DNA-binding protein [Halobacteriales archaeon QS_1_68_20]|nr:MAG: DNA-binding protein [Halobacteriales archaeon QS_1_68_20]
MENESMLTCVSCDNTFEPAPHGGFCPECDTPHPDFGRPEAEDADAEEDPEEEADAEPADDGATEDEEPADDAEEVTADEDADGDAADEPEVDEGIEADDEADEEIEADESDDADEAEVDGEAEDVDEDTELDEAEDVDEDTELDEAEEPDVEADEPEADESDDGTAECGSCGASVDPDASFCPDCGSELREDEGDDEPEELSACPDCGTDVDDESFCPNCGTDLDAVRDRLGDDGGATEEVTLVVDDDSYTFGDGDTFGRQEDDWLESLVNAAGGREEVKYISSEHLTFEVGADGVYVTDTSTNGTSLNGEDLDGDRAELEDGDELELAGRATVRVEL